MNNVDNVWSYENKVGGYLPHAIHTSVYYVVTESLKITCMFHYKNMFCQIVRFDTDSSYRLLEEMLYKIHKMVARKTYIHELVKILFIHHIRLQTWTSLIFNYHFLHQNRLLSATYRHIGIYMGIINFQPGNTLIRTWPTKRTADTYLLRQCPSSSRRCWPLRVCSGLPWQNIALLPSVSKK